MNHWAPGCAASSSRRFASSSATSWASRIQLEETPADLRLRYEDLARDLVGTARALSERLGVELDPANVDRPAHHVTTWSVAASIGRWRNELGEAEAATMNPLVKRLGY